jgi:hypothetical protein
VCVRCWSRSRRPGEAELFRVSAGAAAEALPVLLEMDFCADSLARNDHSNVA